MSQNEAQKHDSEKTPWDLLPLRCMEEVMKVFKYGARHPDRKKNQWRYGTKWSRYWNATMRHLVAFWRGEDLDPESGLHHLAHAVCDAMMLFEMTELKKFDDRENWMGEPPQTESPIQRIHEYTGANNLLGGFHTGGRCIRCGEEKDSTIHLMPIERESLDRAREYIKSMADKPGRVY